MTAPVRDSDSSIRVYISGLRDVYGDAAVSELEEATAAKLRQFKAEQAKYLQPNPNAAKAAELAGDDEPAPDTLRTGKEPE